MNMNERCRQEILALQASNPEKKLMPEAIVAWAKENPDSELHRQLEWDDTVAAQEHRIFQARQLIRIVIHYAPEFKRRIRTLVSVPTDRTQGGGYRHVDDVLNHPSRRAALRQGALEELRRLPGRYGHLPELDPLMAAIVELVNSYDRQMNQNSSAG